MGAQAVIQQQGQARIVKVLLDKDGAAERVAHRDCQHSERRRKRRPTTYFGYGVSLSANGSTALIDAIGKNSFTGTAYVFSRSGTSWSQQQELKASDGKAADYFGQLVSLSGNGSTALIGAYGHNSMKRAAYVFTRSGTVTVPRSSS